MNIPLPTLLHAIFMIAALVFLYLAFTFSTKRKTNTWLTKHWKTALLGIICIITGAIIMSAHKEVNGYPHLASPHAIGGIITIFVAIITPVLGFSVLKGKKHLKPTHTLFGSITLILVAITIILGFLRLLQIINR